MKITIWIQVKKIKVNAIYVNEISLKRCRCNQTMETKQTDIISLKKTLFNSNLNLILISITSSWLGSRGNIISLVATFRPIF